MTTRRRCPVCHRYVKPTRMLNISAHTDKVGRRCPGSDGVPYEYAEAVA